MVLDMADGVMPVATTQERGAARAAAGLGSAGQPKLKAKTGENRWSHRRGETTGTRRGSTACKEDVSHTPLLLSFPPSHSFPVRLWRHKTVRQREARSGSTAASTRCHTPEPSASDEQNHDDTNAMKGQHTHTQEKDEGWCRLGHRAGVGQTGCVVVVPAPSGAPL